MVMRYIGSIWYGFSLSSLCIRYAVFFYRKNKKATDGGWVICERLYQSQDILNCQLQFIRILIQKTHHVRFGGFGTLLIFWDTSNESQFRDVYRFFSISPPKAFFSQVVFSCYQGEDRFSRFSLFCIFVRKMLSVTECSWQPVVITSIGTSYFSVQFLPMISIYQRCEHGRIIHKLPHPKHLKLPFLDPSRWIVYVLYIAPKRLLSWIWISSSGPDLNWFLTCSYLFHTSYLFSFSYLGGLSSSLTIFKSIFKTNAVTRRLDSLFISW